MKIEQSGRNIEINVVDINGDELEIAGTYVQHHWLSGKAFCIDLIIADKNGEPSSSSSALCVDGGRF